MVETGIFIRVGKENVLLEDMDESERVEWLEGLSEKGLSNTVNICCDTINELNKINKELRHRVIMYETLINTKYGKA
jgi:hypothetical protein